MGRLIKFEAEYEHFNAWKVEDYKKTNLHPHCTMCRSLTKLQLKINNFFQLWCLFHLFTLGRESIANNEVPNPKFTSVSSYMDIYYGKRCISIWIWNTYETSIHQGWAGKWSKIARRGREPPLPGGRGRGGNHPLPAGRISHGAGSPTLGETLICIASPKT